MQRFSARVKTAAMILQCISVITRGLCKPNSYYGLLCLPDLDTLISSADCSVFLIWTHWYCLRIVPLPDLDTRTLTAVCSVYLIWTYWIWTWIIRFSWYGDRDHGVCDLSAEDAYFS
jgi:hypothetical protein